MVNKYLLIFIFACLLSVNAQKYLSPGKFATPSAPPSSLKKINIVILDLKAVNIPDQTLSEISTKLYVTYFSSEFYHVCDRKDLDQKIMADDYKMIGILTGADKIVAGSVGSLGQTYSFTLKMIDVKTGAADNILNYRQKGSVQDILHLIEKYYSETKIKHFGPGPASASSFIMQPAKRESEKKMNEILTEIHNSTFISVPDKFTDPLTNIFDMKYRSNAVWGKIRPYDLIEITEGLIEYLPFHLPVKDKKLNSYRAKKIKYVPDRFLNKNSAAEFVKGSYFKQKIEPSKPIEDSYAFALNFKTHGALSEKIDLMTIRSSQSAEGALRDNINISIRSNTLLFILNPQSNDTIRYSGLTPDKWFHVAVSVDMIFKKVEIYVNNRLEIETDITLSDTNVSLIREIELGSKTNSLKKSSFVVDDLRLYDRFITNSEVHCLYYEKNWRTKFLVMHIPFNGTDYEATRIDGNYAFSKKTFSSDRFGFERRAYEFMGTKAGFDYPDYSDINLYGRFTVFIWVKISDDCESDNPVIIDKYNAKFKNGFQLSLLKKNKNKYRIQFIHNGEKLISEELIKKEKWTNIAITYEEGRTALYINGEMDSEKKISYLFGINENSFMLAEKNGKNTGDYFTGSVDDLKIFYRTLSNEEIKLMYKGE